MQKVDSQTFDIVDNNIKVIEENFPEAITDGKIDFDKLQNLLGKYVDNTDEKYNLENTNYDEGERMNNFKLYYISLDDIDRILTDSIPNNPKNEVIVPEMLEIFKEYKNIKFPEVEN
ncbi:MAG: hypothetical protein GX641_02305 [Mollicutes bacterium]|nr:hypothetical protein [Mollicutes bacterium]